MRILFISQLYDPEYSIKGSALMQYWREQGHDVEVITTFPNYPTGKVFDGYKVKFCSSETNNGVKVTRLWSHISHSKSKISRAFSYITFTLMALFTALNRKNIDLVYAYHPQSTTGLIGLIMNKLKKVPFITDVQDLWPDALIATGMNKSGLIVKVLGWWCKVIYKNATQVIVLSEGYKKALVQRGVKAENITVVYNWCPEEARIDSVLSEKSIVPCVKHKPAHFIYAGNMGAAQSLASMIDAVSTFSKDDVIFTLIGGGVEKQELQKLVKEKEISNVIIKDYVPPSQIFKVLSDADVLVVHLRDDPLFRITIPSKTQSSLAMGKPILMAVGGEANFILESANAGVVAEPDDVSSIIASIRELLARREEWPEMAENSRAFYSKNMSMLVSYSRLDDVLKKAVNKL
ncbi:glycosyltransferase family 4 protein [Shewanella electrodiphila]|uniref:Glycosyltransferase family 4 protein n=1 Tax=Shewanella electrodiphila TaxID=934143 RepID=A0ABT0KK34_9GAMM|nr:glycosyltransferase family 4 protein [Shewanella electrodiphila]MCL1044149.1 glycosyltransferase family 4 protein [Shewanella electrodiphila]